MLGAVIGAGEGLGVGEDEREVVEVDASDEVVFVEDVTSALWSVSI